MHITPCYEIGKENVQTGIDVLWCFLNYFKLKLKHFDISAKVIYFKRHPLITISDEIRITYMLSNCFKDATNNEDIVHYG